LRLQKWHGSGDTKIQPLGSRCINQGGGLNLDIEDSYQVGTICLTWLGASTPSYENSFASIRVTLLIPWGAGVRLWGRSVWINLAPHLLISCKARSWYVKTIKQAWYKKKCS
jgi:hypothetical protein